MTADSGAALRGEAIRWHLRIAEGSAEDWEAFTDWLARDAAHALAYDEIEAIDAEAGGVAAPSLPPRLSAANDDQPARRRVWWAGGAAVAAGVAALMMWSGSGGGGAHDLYRMASAPGTTRSVTLASGDAIALNGDSSVLLDRKNLRFARLERGEAAFSIHHDPAAPFVVEVGDERIQDVGTAFNVVRAPDGVRVAVAEGSVVYNPHAEAVRLVAGQSLRDPGGEGPVTLARVQPGNVSAWRHGRLSFESAPLATVAADLAWATGETVHVDPALAGRQFTGTVRLDRDRAALFAGVGRMLAVDVRRDGGGWTLAAPARATR